MTKIIETEQELERIIGILTDREELISKEPELLMSTMMKASELLEGTVLNS